MAENAVDRNLCLLSKCEFQVACAILEILILITIHGVDDLIQNVRLKDNDVQINRVLSIDLTDYVR